MITVDNCIFNARLSGSVASLRTIFGIKKTV